MLHSTFILSLLSGAVSAALSDGNLEKHVGALSLSASFNPVKEAYWTGLPHHRRTPFAVSPDGKSAYLAYLDASETDVHVQQVNPSTFAAVGDAVTVTGGKEAGGLVAHNDGFALLTNEALPSGTSNAPPASTPVAVLYRYTSGKQTFKTFLGGPGVHEADGLSASPDMNGDLAYSEAAGMYGAYFVVTDYTGNAAGHFGDSVQYVNDNGTLETIQGASSSWGCSHNTGIAFEAADSAPFASLCAEDQGAIWLNTKGQSMNGVKVSNENTTNGASGESMGGMSGSYSNLARFIDSDAYIFSWVSKGAKDLSVNDWLGSPFTHSVNRTANRNVAIAQFSDKNTLLGEQATAELGGDGDSQVNWITEGTADCSNTHVAAFDGKNALVTWEEIAEPSCPLIAFGCQGAFTGSYFQLVNDGKKVGEAVKAMDVYVAGDMVTMSDGRICWPYVDMDWKLDRPIQNAASVKEMSFACMSLDGSGNSSTPAASSVPAASSAPAATSAVQSSAQAQPTSVQDVAESTGAPIAETSAAVPQVSSSAAQAPSEGTALPTFEIVSSGASVTPPASSSAAVEVPLPSVDIPLTSIEIPLTTIIPFNPSNAPAFTSSTVSPNPSIGPLSSSTPCSSGADSVPTETPEVPASSALPVESSEASEAPTSTPCTKGTGATPTEVPEGDSSTALPIETPSPEPQPEPEATASSKKPCTGEDAIPTEAAAAPSSAALPTDLPPFLTGTGVPSFPFPSGGFGGHHHHHHPHHRPTGWPSWPSGFGPRPTGGFGFGGQRPSGFAFGGEAGASKTPCGFETRVRPTPTAQ